MKTACVTNVSGGVRPSTGVAMMRMPGRVVPSVGAATPVMMPVFSTVATVAMSGSTASNTKFAGMIVPPAAVRAVAKICAWKPGGKLVDEALTSMNLIDAADTVTSSVASLMTPLSVAVAVIVAGVALTLTPVTFPVASTVAMVSSPLFHATVAVATVLSFASCGIAVSCTVVPTAAVAAQLGVRVRRRRRVLEPAVARRRPEARFVDHGRVGGTGARLRDGRRDEPDFTGGRAHRDRAGRVWCRQSRGPARALRFLHEIVAAAGDRTVELRHLPSRSGRARVLHAQPVHAHWIAARIEQLDEIVGQRRAGVAAAAIDLADHDVRTRARRHGPTRRARSPGERRRVRRVGTGENHGGGKKANDGSGGGESHVDSRCSMKGAGSGRNRKGIRKNQEQFGRENVLSSTRLCRALYRSNFPHFSNEIDHMRLKLSSLFAALPVCAIAASVSGQSAPKPAAAPAAAPAPTTPLPIDPKVRIGTLPNGIRYYIRQNSKPEKRAELRLVVNAGSILETDQQLGLAHFIEHMAFNGTTHFKKNDLVKYLESIGVRFGADLNAYTGFDETVYILPIPTDTARIVDQAFTILDDWAHGQLFDSTEVANERGVVREEWRLGKGAGDRMLHEWLPIALKGSLYADRLPIGNEASIMSATPARLRAFYNKWYRPDLQAVIAVGDFDPAAIEAEIKKHFSAIPKPVNPAPRTLAAVPGNKQPLIAVATDKEATSSDVEVSFKLPTEQTKTVGDYRRDLTERLYLSMFNNRLDEISQKPNAPFLGAGGSKGNFIGRTTDAFTLGAGVKDGEIPQGLEALLIEAKRVDEHGFLQSELDRAKENMLRGYERAYAERDKTPSSSFVQEYIDNYLTHEAIPGIDYEYKLAEQLVPTITLADVNKLASNWITDDNRVIVAESPIKDSVKVPTPAELLAVFDRAAKTPVTAYTETLSSEALVAKA